MKKNKIILNSILATVILGLTFTSSLIETKNESNFIGFSATSEEDVWTIPEEFYERDDVAKTSLEAFSGQNAYGGSEGKFGGVLPNGFGDTPYNINEALANTWTYTGTNYIKDVDFVIDWDNKEIVGLSFEKNEDAPLEFALDTLNNDVDTIFGTSVTSLTPTSFAFKIVESRSGDSFWIGTPEFDHEHHLGSLSGQWIFPEGGISIESVPMNTKFYIDDIAFSGWESNGIPLQSPSEQNLWSIRNPLSPSSFNKLFPRLEFSKYFTLLGIEGISESIITQNEENDLLVNGVITLDGELEYNEDLGADGTEIIRLDTEDIKLRKDGLDKEWSIKGTSSTDAEVTIDKNWTATYDFVFESNGLNFDSFGDMEIVFSKLGEIEENELIVPLEDPSGSKSDIEIITGTSTENSFQIRVSNNEVDMEEGLSSDDNVVLKSYEKIDGKYLIDSDDKEGYDFDGDGTIDKEIVITGTNEDTGEVEYELGNKEVEKVNGEYQYVVYTNLNSKNGLKLISSDSNSTVLQLNNLEDDTTYYLESVELNGVFYGVGDEGNRLSETTIPHYETVKSFLKVAIVFFVIFFVIPVIVIAIWKVWRRRWNINFHADPHGYKADFIELILFNTQKHKKTKRVLVEDMEMYFLDKKLDVKFLTDSKHNKKIIKARIYLDQFDDHESTSKLIAGLLHDHISIRRDGIILDKIHYIEGKKLKKALKIAMKEGDKIELDDDKMDDIKEKIVTSKEKTNEQVIYSKNINSAQLDKVARLPLVKEALALGIEKIKVSGQEFTLKDAPIEVLEQEIWLERQVKLRLENKHENDTSTFEFESNSKEAQEEAKKIKKEMNNESFVEIKDDKEEDAIETIEQKHSRLKKMKKADLLILASTIFEEETLKEYSKDNLISLLEDEEV